MKVALVSPYDFAYPGGVVAHITHLANRLERAGFQVRILAPSSRPPSALQRDELIRLGRPVPIPSGGSVARISLSIWLARRIRRLLEEEAFDLIHLHEPLAPFIPLCVLHYSNAVNVGTFHAFHGSGRLYWLTHRVLDRWARRLHGRIAVSPAARDFVRRYFPGEYRVIPNGIETEHFARPRPPVPELVDGRPTILFVGRLERRKGLRYLVGAYARLKREMPGLRLVVVGPGSLDAEVLRLMAERNVEDVHLVGQVPYEDLPRYYQSADVFCSPAIGGESFGIVLLEAMAAGCPVVATNIPGYAFVTRNGKDGLLVPPRDEAALAEALRTVLTDRTLRRTLSLRGRLRAQAMDWDRVAEQVMAYYDSLWRIHRRVRAPAAAPA